MLFVLLPCVPQHHSIPDQLFPVATRRRSLVSCSSGLCCHRPVPVWSRPCCLSPLPPDTVTHDHEDGVVEFHWKRHRLFNHTACLVLYQLCMEVRNGRDLGNPGSAWHTHAGHRWRWVCVSGHPFGRSSRLEHPHSLSRKQKSNTQIVERTRRWSQKLREARD